MEEIEITWLRASRIWWSWAWRTMLWTIFTAILFGIIIGFVIAIMGIPIEPFTPYIQTFGASIGIFFGILAFKIILAKRFNGFRIVLLRTIDPKALKIDA